MPVCSIVKLLPLGTVDDLVHYCTWFPSAKCNSASGRPRHLGVIVLTILQTGMKLELFFYEKIDVSPPFDVKSMSHQIQFQTETLNTISNRNSSHFMQTISSYLVKISGNVVNY